jgi:ankyrin repeat protein
MSTLSDSCTGMNDSVFGFGTFKRFEKEKNEMSYSDINEAAYSGDVEAVEIFVKRDGVNPGTYVDNVLKNTPLHAACEGGHINVVKYLLHHDLVVDIEPKNELGHEPIEIAKMRSYNDIVELYSKELEK